MRLTNAVTDVLTAAARSDLPFLEKKEIIKQVKLLMPGLKNVDEKVSEAIYQLQLQKKIKNPRIKRVGQGKYAIIKPSIGLRHSMNYWTR